MSAWKVWRDGLILGTVEARTFCEAIAAARLRWPNELTCNRLFDFVLVRQ